MGKKPELLSPAGDWEKLQMAVLYGADAVYLAGTSFGMRSFAGNFDDEALPRAVRFAHDHGVKVHATVNTMPRWNEAEQLPARYTASAPYSTAICSFSQSPAGDSSSGFRIRSR